MAETRHALPGIQKQLVGHQIRQDQLVTSKNASGWATVRSEQKPVVRWQSRNIDGGSERDVYA